MDKRGFTLLEIMVAVAIFTMVMGTLFALSLGFANAAELQEIKINTTDEARRAFLMLAPLLRQASRRTINWGDLPGDSLTFQVARDQVDEAMGFSNGFAVDRFGNLQLSDVITLQRDADDANGDGVAMSQLILVEGGNVRVLANNLQENTATEEIAEEIAEGELAEAPAIPDGVGFWAVQRGAGIEVTVRTEGRTRRGRVYTTTISEFILPRNP